MAETDTPAVDLHESSKVIAKFKSSATKGGQEAYELTVTDAASQDDVDLTVALALKGRRTMLDALEDDRPVSFAP